MPTGAIAMVAPRARARRQKHERRGRWYRPRPRWKLPHRPLDTPVAPSFGLSTAADSRTALAASRGIIVPSSVPGDGLGSSRSRRPSAGSMAASHASFGSPAPVGEAILRPATRPDLLRLSAEEAIRTSDTSDALCRTTLPKLRGSAPALPGPPSCRFHCRRTLRGRHSTDPRTAPHQARLLRRGFRATDSNEPGRLPSVRPGSLDPGRHVAFVVHSRGTASHPLARRSPGSPFRVSLRPRQRPAALAELPLASLTLPRAFALVRAHRTRSCPRVRPLRPPRP